MRILHVTDVYLPRLGGLEVQVHDLAHHQARAGHAVTVLTATAPGPASAPCCDDPGPDHHLVDVRRTGRTFATPWDDVLAERPDVVHVHVSVVSPVAWSAARAATRAGLPVTVTMHSMLSSTGPLALAWRAVGAALGDVTWTAVSQVAASQLSLLLDTPVLVLPNGIDPTQWTPARPGEHAVPTLVAVTRLARRKRVRDLVEVLARVHRHDEDLPWRAVVAGDGPQRAAVQRAVRRHRLDDRVALVGRLSRSRVATVLAAADAFVAPAHLESFGIAALEARCAGLPVVAMRHGGVGDFVTDGLDGYLVGDDDELAARLVGLLRDRAQLQRLGAHLRSRPVALAWPEVLARCEQVYAPHLASSVV
ncbi:MAG: glycosyltransferase family 4 protein [Angustibacter sp.]